MQGSDNKVKIIHRYKFHIIFENKNIYYYITKKVYQALHRQIKLSM